MGGGGVDHLEWCGLERRLVGRVVAGLGSRKPAKLSPWVIVGEAAEVDGDDAVRDLRLLVCLGVERRACPELSVGCRVGVPQGDEVCIFGQAIDDRQDHGLAPHLRESFDEVHWMSVHTELETSSGSSSPTG
jgi:hypothetical protein